MIDIGKILRKNLLQEIGTSKIKSDVKHIKTHSDIDGEYNDSYIFKTNSGNEYQIDFITYTIPGDQIVGNKKIIELSVKHSKENPPKFVYVSLIQFSVKGADESNFNNKTNLNELYEVMGRIMFIVDEFLKHTDINIFLVTAVDNERLNLYLQYIRTQLTNLQLIKSNKKYVGNIDNYFLIKK